MDASSSNVETPGSDIDLNVESRDENLTIMADYAEVLDGLDNSVLGAENKNPTIRAKHVRIISRCLQINTIKNHSCGFLTSTDPKIMTLIQKFKYAARMKSIESCQRDNSRTDGISNYVFGDIASMISAENSEGSTSIKPAGGNSYLTNFKKVSIDFMKRAPDGVDTVSGKNCKYFKTKKGFVVDELLEDGKLVFKILMKITNERIHYGTHVLVYQRGEMTLVVVMLDDFSLMTLARRNWGSNWVKIPNKFDFDDLEVIKKDGEVASDVELEFEFHEHFINILIPFLSKEIMYKGSTVFLDNNNGEYPLWFSTDLLTGKIQLHSYADTSDIVQTKFQLGCFGSGYQLYEEEKPAEISYIKCVGGFDKRSHKTLYSDYNPFGNYLSDYGLWFNLKERQGYYDNTKINNYQPLKRCGFETLDVNKIWSPYIKKRYRNSRTYQPIDDIDFDTIVKGNNILWTVKKDRKYPKLVHFYFEGDDMWLIIVFDDNTLEFHHKSSNSEVFVDVSKLMFNTEDLKITKRNGQELSRMELKFHFRDLLCVIPLGDVVSVSYKDKFYDLRGYRDDLLVFLVYDILRGEVYLYNNAFEIRHGTQLTPDESIEEVNEGIIPLVAWKCIDLFYVLFKMIFKLC